MKLLRIAAAALLLGAALLAPPAARQWAGSGDSTDRSMAEFTSSSAITPPMQRNSRAYSTALKE